MKRLTYDEVACVFACILLLVLSFHSRSLGFVRGYEFNTTMVCVAICLVPMILKRCGAFTLSGPFTILILLAVCLHSLGVLYFSYDQFVHYDTLTHSLSSMVVTICVFLVLMCYHVLNDRVRFAGASLAIFVALLMLGFSVYWEFLENVVDVFTGTRMQYSPFDTVRDVICNTVASFVTSMVLQLHMNRRTPESMVEELDLHPKLVRFIANHKYRRVSAASACGIVIYRHSVLNPATRNLRRDSHRHTQSVLDIGDPRPVSGLPGRDPGDSKDEGSGEDEKKGSVLIWIIPIAVAMIIIGAAVAVRFRR